MIKRINISLPEAILSRLDEVASGSDMDRSAYIQMLIRQDIGDTRYTHDIHTTNKSIHSEESKKELDVYSRATDFPKEKLIKTPQQAKKKIREIKSDNILCPHGAMKGLCKDQSCNIKYA